MYDGEGFGGVRLDLAAVPAAVVHPDTLNLKVGVNQTQTRVASNLNKNLLDILMSYAMVQPVS